MRILGLLVVVVVVSEPFAAFAGSIVEFQLDLSAALRADAEIADSPPEFTLFPNEWCATGIEKSIAAFGDCTGRRRPKSTLPMVSDFEIFSGMWTSTAVLHSPRQVCRLGGDTPVSPVSFDMHWLTDSLWPRTRCYLGGEVTEPGPFGMSLASGIGLRLP
jgi:hypothetical protein